MVAFAHGQSVKIDPRVYDYQWEGYEDLYKRFKHHNLTVDRIIDLSDVGKGEWVIVNYLGIKAQVRSGYLTDTSIKC